MRRTLRLLVPVLLALPAAPARASEETLKTFDACWNLVRGRFYDRGLHGVDWREVRDFYRPVADDAQPGDDLHRILNQMLSELGASHCAILEGDVYHSMRAELGGQRRPTFGLLLEETRPGELFVRAFYENGPADRAGLERGDRLLAVEDEPVFESPWLVDAGYDPALPGPPLYFLQAGSLPLELEMQSHPGRGGRYRTTIRPERMNGEDAARRSVQVVERDGLQLGVIHLWYCSRGISGILRRALTGPLADCDAVVVDLRGRGGYAHEVDRILDLFASEIWHRPAVFLIDERSRSAKELLAFRIRHNELGTLVGRRTEGACLGAGFFPLPDGSYLELPVLSIPVHGVVLEGRGVPPDVEVGGTLPHARGRDPILEAGLEEAARTVPALEPM